MTQLPDRKRPDLAPLAPAALDVLGSNWPPSLSGVFLEQHRYWPGARGHCSLSWHLIFLQRSSVSRGERGNGRGGFVPFAKTRGTITVLPAGCGPPIRLTDPSEVVVYALDPRDLATVVSEIDGPTLPDLGFIGATHDRDLLELLRLLGREVAAGGPCGKLYSDALAFSLLARALSLSSQPTRPFFSISSALSPRAQQRVLEYIEANLQRNIGLQELADLVGYSRGHFLRMFRVATGTTPHRYLTERRIERAKALLTGGQLALTDVAAFCGFSSQSHLSTEFRRRTGMSPARFRRTR